jgi:hypothetical protein
MIYIILCLVVAVVSILAYMYFLEGVGNPFLFKKTACIFLGIIFPNLATILSPLYWEYPGIVVPKRVFVVKDGQAIQSPSYGACEFSGRVIVLYGPASTNRTFTYMHDNIKYSLQVKYSLEVTDLVICSDVSGDWLVGYRGQGGVPSFRQVLPKYFSEFADRIFESNHKLFIGGTREEVEKYVQFWSSNVAPNGYVVKLVEFERHPSY